jgi:hypothetical protein
MFIFRKMLGLQTHFTKKLLQTDVAQHDWVLLWNAFFDRFGLCWVMPGSVKELLTSWWSSGRSRSAVVWKMVPLCIMWCIWSERNLRCFEDSSRSIEDLLHVFLFTLFSWTAGWLAPRVISFSDFLSLFSPPPPSPFVYPLCTKGCAPFAHLNKLY